MDRVKKIKVKKSDGSMTDYIPIGVDAKYVDFPDGTTLEGKLTTLKEEIETDVNATTDEKIAKALENVVTVDEDGNVSIEGNLTVGGDVSAANFNGGGGGGGGIPIGHATDINATSHDESATVKWTDPTDVIIQDMTLAHWGGTKLVIKEGSYPTSATDGTLKVDSTTRDQYKTSGFEITGLTNDTEYYGALFPYSKEGYVNTDIENRFIVTPGAVFPSKATNIQIQPDSKALTFTVSFTMPGDATKATVVMKKGSIPSSATDGTAKTNLTSGQTAVFDGIVKDEIYHFVVYTYNAKNRETRSDSTSAKIASLEVVTFKDGTDAQIAAMLEAHYDGSIDIADYWSVGDERTVHLNATSTTSTKSKAHVAQNMTMVIIGINHDDLKTQQGTRTKAAITVQCRETLGNKGSEEDEYYWGTSHYPVQDTENYTTSPLRTWLNGAFISAMPTTFGALVKTVNKKNLAKHTTSSGAPVNSEDKAFLLSYPEVFGTTKYSYYLNNGDVGTYEGTQYKYYQTSANRTKKPNNNGSKGSGSGYWWLRSPSSYYNSSTGYRWCRVNSDGTADYSSGNGTLGLAPAFAL